MTTLLALCERPMPTSVRIEVFCRVLAGLDELLRRRQRPRALDPDTVDVGADGAVEFGAAVSGVVVDHVGLLRVAELVFALEPGRLARETAPGAPWVLEHIVARLRAGDAPLPAVMVKGLEPFRARVVDVDDNGLEDLRRREAVELVQHATRLATAIGPGDAVLFALDEACRVDPDFGDPRDRRSRVAQSVGGTLGAGSLQEGIDGLRAEVLDDMRLVLRSRDPTIDPAVADGAAARVAAVLQGPGADVRRILDPLGTAVARIAAHEPRVLSRAAIATVVVAVAAVVAGSVGFLAARPATPLAPPVAVVVEAAPVEPPAAATPAQPTTQATALPGPAIVNVWLESCADCMPTFSAWAKLVVEQRLPAGARVVNVAYGSSGPGTDQFATRWHVADELQFDVDGARVVRPLGIGTFTTFVTDAGGTVVWRGRAVDPTFIDDLSAAWRRVAPRPADVADASTRGPLDGDEARFQEAQQHIFSGDFRAALSILNELEKVSPDDARIHRSLGISHARLRDPERAARHYRRYLVLAPNAPDADKVREILAASPR